MLTNDEAKCLANIFANFERLNEFERGRLVGIGEAMEALRKDDRNGDNNE